MTIREGLGIVLLGALAASCSSSSSKSLESQLKGDVRIETQAPEITQDVFPQRDLNNQRLNELMSLYPSPNLVPVYVGDFNAFIDRVSLDNKLMIEAAAAQNPAFWKELLGNFDNKTSPNFYLYRTNGITTSEKLEQIIAEPESKRELGEAIAAEISGRVLLDGLIYFNATGPLPSFLPIFVFDEPSSFGKNDAAFVFNFSKEAFEMRRLYKDDGVVTINPQTNSLTSYMLAKIYAEQMARGEIAGEKISIQDRMSLDESLRIDISRASALIGTYRYFLQRGSQYEASFVGIVLGNHMRTSGINTYNGVTTHKEMVLVEKLKKDYNALFSAAAK